MVTIRLNSGNQDIDPSLPLTTTKLFKLFYKEGIKRPWGKAIPSYQSILQQGENPPVTVNVFQ